MLGRLAFLLFTVLTLLIQVEQENDYQDLKQEFPRALEAWGIISLRSSKTPQPGPIPDLLEIMLQETGTFLPDLLVWGLMMKPFPAEASQEEGHRSKRRSRRACLLNRKCLLLLDANQEGDSIQNLSSRAESRTRTGLSGITPATPWTR